MNMNTYFIGVSGAKYEYLIQEHSVFLTETTFQSIAELDIN